MTAASTLPPPPPPVTASPGDGLPPGAEIGGYTVVRLLGRGAMGAVYEATDDGGNAVALKVLHAHLDTDPTARERLRREVEALQRLRHEAVARVLDAELEGENAFIVTELLEGPTLEAEIDSGGPLDAIDLFELADQLAAALNAIHLAGVVHRDLKPSNVMITPNGPMLIDFGIAAAYSETEQAADTGGLTQHGLVIGTPGYIAPELIDGGEPSPASDWWSWAALLAFAGTGRAPFGVRPVDVVLRRSREGMADLVGLPARTARALSAALQPEKTARWAAPMVVRSMKRDADDAEFARAGGHGLVPATALEPVPPITGAIPVAMAGGAVAALDGTMQAQTGQLSAVSPALPPIASGPEQTMQMHWMPLAADQTQVVHTATGPIPLGDVKYQPYSALTEELGEAHADPTDPHYVPVQQYETLLRPSLTRRVGTVAALLLPLTALAATRPGLAVVLFAALLVLCRIVGHAWLGLWERREKARSVRSSDVPVTLAKTPLYILLGIVAALPQLLSGLLVGFGVWWLGNRLLLTDIEPGSDSRLPLAVVALAFVAFALVAWFGPASKAGRIGARLILNAVAPSTVGASAILALCLIATFILARPVLVDHEHEINWGPLPNLQTSEEDPTEVRDNDE